MATRRPPKAPISTKAAPEPAAPGAVVGVRRLFTPASRNYFLLLGTTLFLVGFGLVMVLSSSSIESHVQQNGFFGGFLKQGLYALFGLPLMLIAASMRPQFWRRMAGPAMLLAVVLQLLVFTPLGFDYGGNRNWISFGPGLNGQPSEFVKIALIVWIAYLLSRPGDLADWRRYLIPVGIASGVAISLVLLGKDLGTVVIMVLIVFGCLYFAGISLRYLLTGGVAVALLGIVVAMGTSSRTQRISVWLNGCTEADYLESCWQQMHGTWALAAGGILGVGPGNSKAKWSWLPEADNDYIFAIIGEELGLIGAVVVLVLFFVLAVAFIRIIRANPDPFARVVTSGVMVWIIGQAVVNIAVVLGLLPVLGVPLPLISAGGSALISSMLAIGVVLSFARTRPERAVVEAELSPAERSRRAAMERIERSHPR
jgi:cell division protein FtsW